MKGTDGDAVVVQLLRPEIKVGDIVQLMSGGPRMTVAAVLSGSPAHAIVVWFQEGDELKEAKLSLVCLKILAA